MHSFQKINFLLIAYLLILFIVGLWPFIFNPKNNVHWIENKPGICIKEDGIIYSEQLSPRLYKRLISTKDFTIETILQPTGTFTQELSFILACGAVGKQNNFALAQRHNHLIVFLKTTDNPVGQNVHTIEARNIFGHGGQKHIVTTWNDGSVKIFVDGSLVKNSAIPGTFSNWDSGARIFVGNDDSGEHSWEGNIYRIAVYERTPAPQLLSHKEIKSYNTNSLLCYDFKTSENKKIITDCGVQNFKQDLFIPEHFKVLGKTILSLPNRYFLFSLGFFKDALINILGFIPLGALVFLRTVFSGRSTHRAFCASVFVGLMISFLIEVAQIYLPLRSSSLIDLFNNTVGSFIGAYIFWVCTRRGYRYFYKY